MVGAFSVVGSSMVDSHACPCLCVDALPSCNLVSGDLVLHKNPIRKKHMPRPSSLELSTSFLDSWPLPKSLSAAKDLKKQRKNTSRLLIVNELAGQYEDGFEDVKATLLNYFTHKAVRTVMTQLYEMNPPQYRWFYDFVRTNRPGDGKNFIRKLGKEKQDLAERVMITRLHLYGKWIKKCDHAEIYKHISDQNLELMRERLLETVVWPSDDTNTEMVG